MLPNIGTRFESLYLARKNGIRNRVDLQYQNNPGSLLES